MSRAASGAPKSCGRREAILDNANAPSLRRTESAIHRMSFCGRLRNRYDIGPHADRLKSEEFPEPSHPALNFIEDQECATFVAEPTSAYKYPRTGGLTPLLP